MYKAFFLFLYIELKPISLTFLVIIYTKPVSPNVTNNYPAASLTQSSRANFSLQRHLAHLHNSFFPGSLRKLNAYGLSAYNFTCV